MPRSLNIAPHTMREARKTHLYSSQFAKNATLVQVHPRITPEEKRDLASTRQNSGPFNCQQSCTAAAFPNQKTRLEYHRNQGFYYPSRLERPFWHPSCCI